MKKIILLVVLTIGCVSATLAQQKNYIRMEAKTLEFPNQTIYPNAKFQNLYEEDGTTYLAIHDGKENGTQIWGEVNQFKRTTYAETANEYGSAVITFSWRSTSDGVNFYPKPITLILIYKGNAIDYQLVVEGKKKEDNMIYSGFVY